jgi:hypothetical protein
MDRGDKKTTFGDRIEQRKVLRGRTTSDPKDRVSGR